MSVFSICIQRMLWSLKIKDNLKWSCSAIVCYTWCFVAWPVTCTRQNFRTQLIINQLSPFLWQFIVSSILLDVKQQPINQPTLFLYYCKIIYTLIHLEVSVLGNKSSILIVKLIYHITGSKSGPLDLMVFFCMVQFWNDPLKRHAHTKMFMYGS